MGNSHLASINLKCHRPISAVQEVHPATIIFPLKNMTATSPDRLSKIQLNLAKKDCSKNIKDNNKTISSINRLLGGKLRINFK